MANRVIASELRKIVTPAPDSDPVSDLTLDLFISNANLLVNETLATAGLSTDRMKLIELYLAAHFYVLTSEQGGLIKEEVGDASRTYNLMTKNVGLNFTRFGQQVAMLDPTGAIAAAGSAKPPALFEVI